MSAVAARTQVEFHIYGTSEAEAADYLQPIRDAGARCIAWSSMPYDEYLDRVRSASVGLQPVCIDSDFSRGKSFGKILAYLAGDVPVVASRAVDHPYFFRSHDNGMLVDSDAEWVEAIVSILEDRSLRARLSKAAYADFEQRLTTEVFAAHLDRLFRKVMLPQ